MPKPRQNDPPSVWMVYYRGQLERTRAALKPFADYAPRPQDGVAALPDNLVITNGSSMARRQLTLGDVRTAKQVYDESAG